MPDAALSAPLVALADRCVQCGLCLPACPTYRLDQIETESPRGRIALVRAWALEAAAPTGAGETHLDHCLGCRRCEAACPAGVEYGALLVGARAAQRQRRPVDRRQRAIEALVARPRLLGMLLALYRCSWPLLPPAWRPLPKPPARTGAGSGHDSPRATVALFTGCVAGIYETPLRHALQRLARAAGIDIATPPTQACCGAVHAHAGDTSASARLAARNRVAFAGARTVLTLASGCHDAVASALPGASVIDAAAYLALHGDSLRFRETRERVALHLPCTQRGVAHGEAATRALLSRVPGLEVAELDPGFGCCGAAGTAMLLEPGRADAFRRPLLGQFTASGATRLLSANLGCRLHFANATRLPVQHPLEFLAQCLA